VAYVVVSALSRRLRAEPFPVVEILTARHLWVSGVLRRRDDTFPADRVARRTFWRSEKVVLYEIYSPYMDAYTTSIDWPGLVIYTFPFGSQTKRFRLRPFPYVQETT